MALKVVTGYRFSQNHDRFYASGTKTYDGQTVRRTLSMSLRCECGEPIYDGDPICGELYDERRYVHVRCCAEHSHDPTKGLRAE